MDFLKKHYVHLVAIVIFFVSTLATFFPSFQGEKLQQGDIVHWKGMAQEVISYHDKTGETSLWTNSMFGGMPTYYIWFKQATGPIDLLKKVVGLGFTNEVGKFMTGMILFYVLLILLGVNPWLAIFASMAFAYSTNNLVLLNAGHTSKIWTLMTSPLIIAGVILAYRNKALLGTLLFTLGMSFNLKSQHPQMTYYLGLILLLYVFIVFIDKMKNGEIMHFAKASGLLVLGLLLAIGTTANRTLPIYEYSKDTMRGAPILKNNKSADSSSKVEGLAWDYAMAWSNGPEDLLQSFIPLAVGGSSSEPLAKGSEFEKALRKRNYPTKGMKAPMYWGSLPFTSGPIYFGAVIFFLFFLSLFTLNDNIKWWVLGAVLLTFLLSMGKNFSGFNRHFFDYFPYYNKFRTPNSILSVTAVVIPLAAILGLQNLAALKELPIKRILIAGGGFILMTVLLGLGGSGIFTMTSAGDANLAQSGFDADIFMEDRAAMLRGSALRSALLMAVTLGAIWAYSRNKMKAVPMFILIGVLALGDLFITNKRYVSADNYVSERDYKRIYTPRKVDTQILQDTDPHYRVFDVTQNPFNSSFASYFHKSVGGYHAAKLQRYQDLIDYHISKNNTKVLNMLNTKYVIQGEPGKEQANLNSAALGNAWFVNEVRYVPTPDAEIESLSEFDPLGTAIVNQEFSALLNNKSSYDKTGNQINLTGYKPDKLSYQVQAANPGLAVFSEIWYGPDKGWQAYIDDKPVKHIRANYALRALEIPAGQHTVRFEFKPQSNITGKLISMISSLIFFLLVGWYAWKEYKTFKSLV